MSVHQAKARAVIGLESPIAVQRCLHAVAENGRAQARGVDDEPALCCVGGCRQFQSTCRPSRSGSMSCHARSRWKTPAALPRPATPARFFSRSKSPSGPPRAAEGVARCSIAGSATTSTDFGLWNDGAVFSVNVELVALQRCERRNVLVLRGMKRIHDARNVQHRGDIGAVVAVARLRGVAGLHRQIGCQDPRSAPPRSRCYARRSR